MLKIRSLSKKKDFDQVFKQGRSCYYQKFGVKVFKNEINQNRLGIIISRKVSKKAVVRNKIKRRIKEIFRLWADRLMLGQDILVIVLPEAGRNVPLCVPTYQEIIIDLEQSLRRLKMFK